MVEIKRKRKIQARSIETQKLILDGTAHFLLKYDWDELTTNKVADYTGVSIGTLYKYYRNKEELLKALVRNQFEEDLREYKLMAEETHTSDFSETVRDLVRMTIRQFAKQPRLRLIIESEGRKLNLISEKRSTLGRIRNLLIDNFEKHAKGRYKKPDEVTMFVISSAVMGSIMATCAERPALLKDEKFERHLINLLLGYYEFSGKIMT